MVTVKIETPYYLIDESLLLKNLKKFAWVREKSGAKLVLALKCFSTWAVFDLIKKYMDGTTSSSLYEARLGAEKFGKEVHAYSVAWSESDVKAVRKIATKIIFNSISQLKRFLPLVRHIPVGLRVNPGVSHSDFDLADPARAHSRLGARDLNEILRVSPALSGVMFHCNCENEDFGSFEKILGVISAKFGGLLEKLEWVSLGGGITFTKENYPIGKFCDKISAFSRRYKVQVCLEPGETAITRSGFLVTKVLDIVRNKVDIAIVDAAVETHMLDLLTYGTPAKMDLPPGGRHTYTVAGRTCLAGDEFGTYRFPKKLRVGSRVVIADAAGYTMVKKNWFNGVQMPSIVVKRRSGRLDVVRKFNYQDYIHSLS
ncbi:MAG: carboxynorspermidine decarboxylase [Elusimicrobia bacterium]|nr:carboxynorspermidine decarboxylase [Candidatus Obscuribacterium magneticum]